MRGLGAAAVLALATSGVWPSGAAESALTPRNSVVAPLVFPDRILLAGVGCGVPASATVTLPSGAHDIRVRRPAVGDRNRDVQVTGVVVQDTAVTFTGVADGDGVCDPGVSATPPSDRLWLAGFEVEIAFTQRVGVLHWNRDHPRAKPFVARPREVRIRIVGAARGVRWTRFGGRTAVGLGRFKSLIPCRGGCSDDGTRLRVELSRPGRCPGQTLRGRKEDVVFYGEVAFVLRQRLGVLRPGTEWISTRLTCPTGAPPIPIR